MQLPNTLSLSVIAAVTMVINSQYPDLWWSPVALAALVAIGKLIQVNVAKPAETTRSLGPDGASVSVQEPSKIKEFLVG